MAFSDAFLDLAQRELEEAKATVVELTSLLRRSGRIRDELPASNVTAAENPPVRASDLMLSATISIIVNALHSSKRTSFRPSEMRAAVESLQPDTPESFLDLIPDAMARMLAEGGLERDAQGRYVRPERWLSPTMEEMEERAKRY